VDINDTQRTLTWVRDNLNDYEDRERALAYYIMIEANLATEDEKKSLKNLLISQQEKLGHLSEIDLITYLKSAVKVGTVEIIIPIIRILQRNQKDGCWVDLATTATAETALLDALKLLRAQDPQGYIQIREILEQMIFKSIIYIQMTMEKVSESISYPWDNKASTSLKCIEAWLNFENLIDLPVRELTDALKSYSAGEKAKSTVRTSLTILDELKNKIGELIQERSKLSADVQKSRKAVRLNMYLWLTSLLSIYAVLSVIIYSFYVGFDTSITGCLKTFSARG
jgi:hypothetical protein